MPDHLLRLKYLLHQYLHNSISPEELDELWQLMAKLPKTDLLDLEIAGFWNNPSLNDQNTVDWEKVYSRLQGKMNEPRMNYTRIMRPRSRTIKQIAVAASVLLMIATASYLFLRPLSHPSAKPALASRPVRSLQLIRLPDGTTVTLNKNSRLDYPSRFDGTKREVVLYGEAFFDVQHDATRPFIVHTSNLVVRVLGTAFNIKAYDADDKIAVTVSRGKVQVQRNNTANVLGLLVAGDQLLVDKNIDRTSQAKVDVKEVLTWKTILAFDNRTMEEAAGIISNYFGIEIRFDQEALRSCRFTADLGEHENDLAQVMNVMTLLTGSTWTKTDQAILISGKGCND